MRKYRARPTVREWDTVGMVDAPQIRDADGAIRRGRTVLAGSDWQMDIEDPDLSFVRIDHQTRLQFGDVEVMIESPFVLTIAGADHLLDPGDRWGLGPLLGLYPDSLTASRVDPDGTLLLNFAGGASVAVPQDVNYEAWSVIGRDNALVVCMPGTAGELAIWGRTLPSGG
jgi:Family of unknown function (DUF6188)